MPHPDSDPYSVCEGALYRFASKTPDPEPLLLSQFRTYVRKWIRKKLKPLPPDTDVTVESWLKERPYPRWRKDQLQKAFDETVSIFEKRDKPPCVNKSTQFRYALVKSFCKDEVYPEYKYPRSINSRVDEFKCATGPIFHHIENALFELPEFIKHIPVPDRPRYILERLLMPGASYSSTDFSFFEAHFIEMIMQAAEGELYDYMTSLLPDHDLFMDLFNLFICGFNECSFKYFTIIVRAKRMSGDMCTSLGNGFTNCVLMSFVCKVLLGMQKFRGIFEGDDGACRAIGIWPTADVFARLGFTIKMQIHEHLHTMSFCGMVFDPQDLQVVADPRESLVTFGWTTGKYAGASLSKLNLLLRSKALSLLHEYPGCPILRSLGFYALRNTVPVSATRMYKHAMTVPLYEREQLLTMYAYMTFPRIQQIMRRPILPRTRVLVEDLYGVSIGLQSKIEFYLDHKNDLSPLDCNEIMELMRPTWIHYFRNYVDVITVRNMEDYPPMTFTPSQELH